MHRHDFEHVAYNDKFEETIFFSGYSLEKTQEITHSSRKKYILELIITHSYITLQL